MSKEHTQLLKMETWNLVPAPPSNVIVLGNRWVLKTKYGVDGKPLLKKARLVVQGFTQIPGIDFFEIYASVVRPSSFKALFTLAAQNDWLIHQMDVKTAFLNGKLEEILYMKQPQGFEDKDKPTWVCKLIRALYGLKQSPRIWFHTLSEFLKTQGFLLINADQEVLYPGTPRNRTMWLSLAVRQSTWPLAMPQRKQYGSGYCLLTLALPNLELHRYIWTPQVQFNLPKTLCYILGSNTLTSDMFNFQTQPSKVMWAAG